MGATARMLSGLAAGLAVALQFAPAAAAPARWAVDPAASEASFAFTVNGRPREGRFTEIAGEGTFDPDDPSAARLRLTIAIASLDLGDPLESNFAQGPEWFDAADHPEAVYRLARLTPTDEPGVFEALGDLTIKGRLKVLRTPVSVVFEGDTARAEGALDFDRRDFGVGVGPSALLVNIGTDAAVRFAITARRLD